jgi:hypothetical protein
LHADSSAFLQDAVLNTLAPPGGFPLLSNRETRNVSSSLLK